MKDKLRELVNVIIKVWETDASLMFKAVDPDADVTSLVIQRAATLKNASNELLALAHAVDNPVPRRVIEYGKVMTAFNQILSRSMPDEMRTEIVELKRVLDGCSFDMNDEADIPN